MAKAQTGKAGPNKAPSPKRKGAAKAGAAKASVAKRAKPAAAKPRDDLEAKILAELRQIDRTKTGPKCLCIVLDQTPEQNILAKATVHETACRQFDDNHPEYTTRQE